MTDTDRFVKLTVVENLFEGQRIQALLEGAEIPCQIRSFEDSAYAGLYQSARGWGEARVRREDMERAEALLAQVQPDQVDAASLDEEASAAPSPSGEGRAGGRTLFILIAVAALAGLLLWLLDRL